MNDFKGFWYLICSLYLVVLVGCGGDEFGAAGTGGQPDADSADTQPEADAGQLDVQPKPDAHPEADVVALDVPSDAVPDAVEEPDVQALDVQIPDVAVEDGPPLTYCQKWGKDGFITVIIHVGEVSPSGQVLAVYGTVKHNDPDAGVNLPYAAWEFGQSGQTQIIAKPTTQQSGLELLFAWGFTNSGNLNFNSWVMRCTATGCDVNDLATVCAGKEFVGSFDHGQFKPGSGTCTYKLNGSMTVDEVDCIINN